MDSAHAPQYVSLRLAGELFLLSPCFSVAHNCRLPRSLASRVFAQTSLLLSTCPLPALSSPPPPPPPPFSMPLSSLWCCLLPECSSTSTSA